MMYRQFKVANEDRLNTQQTKAVLLGTADHGISLPPVLLMGPFGTGKTFTLAQTALEILQMPDTRILICTHSNRCSTVDISCVTLYYYYYFLTPVLNSQGMKKLRYAIQKSTKIKLEWTLLLLLLIIIIIILVPSVLLRCHFEAESCGPKVPWGLDPLAWRDTLERTCSVPHTPWTVDACSLVLAECNE